MSSTNANAARRWASGLAGLAMLAGGALAHAHTQTGTLGSPAQATDYYQVTCTNDGGGAPASLAIQVLDVSPVVAPHVSVQVKKDLAVSSTSDIVDGDAGASPATWINGGAGVYDVIVDKSGVGAETYSLTFHCVTGVNGTGSHTGTTVVTKQNQ